MIFSLRACVALALTGSAGLAFAQDADDTAPTVPDNLVVKSSSPTAAGVVWQPSNDDNGVSAYEVTLNDKLVQESEDLRYINMELAPDTVYQLGVTAIDTTGQRSKTAYIDFDTKGDDLAAGESGSELLAEGEAEPLAEPEAGQVPMSDTDADPMAEGEAEPLAEPEAGQVPMSDTDADPMAEGEAEPLAEPEAGQVPMSDTDADPMAEGEADPLAEPEAGQVPMPDTDADPMAEGEPMPDAESDPMAEGEPMPDAESDPMAEGEPMPDAESDPMAEGEPMPDAESDGGSQSDQTLASVEDLRATIYSTTALGLIWERPETFGLRYEVSRDGEVLIADTDAVTYIELELEPGAYTYEVVAIDRQGARSEPVSLDVSTVDMPMPGDDMPMVTPTGNSILDLARGTDEDEDGEFTGGAEGLESLVSTLGVYPELLEVLDDETAELTVFAPSNDAFAAVDLSGLDEREIDNVLRYHVVPDMAFNTMALSGEEEFPMTLTTAQGGTVEITDSGDGTLAAVDAGGNEVGLDMVVDSASNGVVYVIDAVLVAPDAPEEPPVAPGDEPMVTPVGNSILDLARGTDETGSGEFTGGAEGLGSLVSTVGAYPELVQLLDDETAQLTVFAPSDDAFAAADLSGLDEAGIENVLSYHVLPNMAFNSVDHIAEDGFLPLQLETAQGGLIEIMDVGDGTLAAVDAAGNTVALDMIVDSASNGVVYVIDAVLTPPAPTGEDGGSEGGDEMPGIGDDAEDAPEEIVEIIDGPGIGDDAEDAPEDIIELIEALEQGEAPAGDDGEVADTPAAEAPADDEGDVVGTPVETEAPTGDEVEEPAMEEPAGDEADEAPAEEMPAPEEAPAPPAPPVQ